MNAWFLAKFTRKWWWVTLSATLCALTVNGCSDSGDAKERALVQLRGDYLERLNRGLTLDSKEDRRREVADVCGMLVSMFYTESAADVDQLRFWDANERIRETSFCISVTLSRVEEISQDEHRRLADECSGATAELARLLCDRARFY